MKPSEEEVKIFTSITSGLSKAVENKEVKAETASQAVKAYFKLRAENPDTIWGKQ